MLPILLLLVPPFTTVRVNIARFSAVGVGVMLPILLLLVPPWGRPVREKQAVFFGGIDVYV